ncbi:MAG TPA: hypothetical protein VF057_12355 [Thermoanaerobaculia bacterium]
MRPRVVFVLIFIVAIATTLVSGHAYQRLSTKLYPYSGVEPGTSYKPEVVGGWPLPFLIDGHVSPVNSVDVVGALLGMDRWSTPAFIADVAIHFAFLSAVYVAAQAVKRLK